MNYPHLLARGLLILYSAFLLLFAFGEEFLKVGYMHAVPALIILVIMVLFKDKPVISFLSFFLLAVFTTWFLKTYVRLELFLILSAPLLVASVLFLFNRKKLKS